MRDPGAKRRILQLEEEPIRRGFFDQNIRLDLRGNFDRGVEVTSGLATRANARRGR
jgi:hypothetical protein